MVTQTPHEGSCPVISQICSNVFPHIWPLASSKEPLQQWTFSNALTGKLTSFFRRHPSFLSVLFIAFIPYQSWRKYGYFRDLLPCWPVL